MCRRAYGVRNNNAAFEQPFVIAETSSLRHVQLGQHADGSRPVTRGSTASQGNKETDTKKESSPDVLARMAAAAIYCAMEERCGRGRHQGE